MEFTERTRLEEILIRMGLDAQGREVVVGAHSQKITEALVDGEVRFAQPGVVAPLITDGEGAGTLSEALGSAALVALTENAALKASLAAAQSVSGSLSEHLTAAQAEIQRLTDLLSQSAAVAETPETVEQPAA